MIASAPARSRDLAKWAFFAVAALATLLVIYIDEGFVIHPADPYWKHIHPYQWILALHAVSGAAALVLGPFQFSTTLRRARPTLHRWSGRVYVGAVAIAAPIGGYIGSVYLPAAFHVQQPAQAGGCFLTTTVALACILKRNLSLHRAWMMKSYAFCLVFVMSRLPDALPSLGLQGADAVPMLWWLVVAALIGPDLILTGRELARRR